MYQDFNIHRDELQIDIWFRTDWESFYSHMFDTRISFYIENDLIFNSDKFKEYFLDIIYKHNTEKNPKYEEGFKIFNGSHELMHEGGRLRYLTPFIIEREINENWGITTDDFIEAFRKQIISYLNTLTNGICESLEREKERIHKKLETIKTIENKIKKHINLK